MAEIDQIKEEIRQAILDAWHETTNLSKSQDTFGEFLNRAVTHALAVKVGELTLEELIERGPAEPKEVKR